MAEHAKEAASGGPESAGWHQEPLPLLDGLYDPAGGLPDALRAVAQALVDAPLGVLVRITIREA